MMSHDDPNLPYLRVIAAAIGELRECVVFVGGATAGLLVTDPVAESVRATKDVDVIVAAGFAEYARIEQKVAALGFARDIDSEVICRWIHRDSGILFDLMPVDPEVLGFSNRWYPYAVETAQQVELGGGLSVRMVTAVAFVATKLAAFADRGHGDVFGSHDLEDVLNIVDGRESLEQELSEAPPDLRDSVREAFVGLLAHRDFNNALPGHVTDPNRVPVIMKRLRRLAA